MTIAPWLLAIHLLGVAIWVGGMVFAIVVLRPSLSVLDPAERMLLNGEAFGRFFRLVWHAMPLVLLSGYAMLFLVYGGFRYVAWPVHVMHLTGLVMALVFLATFFGPWKKLRASSGGGDAMAAVGRIRSLSTINLVLGVLTIAVAAFAGH
jgi:uncharacterized membrane protein